MGMGMMTISVKNSVTIVNKTFKQKQNYLNTNFRSSSSSSSSWTEPFEEEDEKEEEAAVSVASLKREDKKQLVSLCFSLSPCHFDKAKKAG